MIRVLTVKDMEFLNYKEECKNLYETVQDKICDKSSFNFICQNTLLYVFLINSTLIGGIYYFLDDEGKLFLNGFSKRKMYPLTLDCLKMSLKWFKGSIYAEAQNRASALCLLKCGFKKTKKKTYVFYNFK